MREDDALIYTAKYRGVIASIGVTSDRLIVKAGKLSALHFDLPLTDVIAFALVPVMRIVADQYGYTAELLLSCRVNGKVKRRRIGVDAQDPTLQQILQTLATKCPDASLLHLEPADAHRALGMADTKKTVWIVLGTIGVALLLVLIIGLAAG